MTFNRRDFLKVAGLSAAAGLGGKAAFELIFPGQVDAAEEMKQSPTELMAKRWGMAIDVKKLTPELRQAITQACHLNHNVPTIPAPKNIKWIWEAPFEHVFTEVEQEYLEEEVKEAPMLAMCNHCDNPPCVRVCPTKATFRRADGIVMMDMHRCIGCRFCMAACPYGSRSFNFYDPRKFLPEVPPNKEYPTRTKGVVEKCTFCTERLVTGQLPYCVEAAKGAMLFGDMSDAGSAPRKALRSRFSIRRNPGLGTQPQVYYLV
jgi:Fe-S-cluster-containing dehydrogenase component